MSYRSYLISGAGSGIGRAIAHKIASCDPESSVILLGRNRDRMEQVRQELPRSEAHRILLADLQDRQGLIQSMREARLELTHLKAVIANAGVGGENHYGEQDRWDEIIETNLSGTYHLIQEALPALRAAGEQFRHVVIVSSVLARLGVPKYSAYCASKAGLLGLTRSLAAELASERILVNAICPGWVETEMTKEGLADIAKASGRSFEEVRKIEMERIPLGKMSTPAEVAALVQFLVSDGQSSITGQALDINGGAVMA
ncbi:MAG: SDR family NAD(P)-dependent oxidoreductase [Bdellovibrionia bacterium]